MNYPNPQISISIITGTTMWTYGEKAPHEISRFASEEEKAANLKESLVS